MSSTPDQETEPKYGKGGPCSYPAGGDHFTGQRRERADDRRRGHGQRPLHLPQLALCKIPLAAEKVPALLLQDVIQTEQGLGGIVGMKPLHRPHH